MQEKLKGKFRPFMSVADYNYGVKGFEIKFQGEIEEYLQKNEITDPWWKWYGGSIFEEILNIYNDCAEKAKEGIEGEDYLLLTELNKLYDKIKEEVKDRLKSNDRVIKGKAE